MVRTEQVEWFCTFYDIFGTYGQLHIYGAIKEMSFMFNVQSVVETAQHNDAHVNLSQNISNEFQ